jgi:hypothetical protein
MRDSPPPKTTKLVILSSMGTCLAGTPTGAEHYRQPGRMEPSLSGMRDRAFLCSIITA